MRHSLSFLIFSIVLTLATAQEPTVPEPTPEASPPALESTPAATPAPETPASPLLNPANASDQDFLKLPNLPGQSTDLLPAAEVPLAEGMAPLPETDQDFVDPNQLMPADGTSPAPIDPRTLAAGGDEQERKLKVRYKEVRVKAEKDPAVVALLETAKKARTFEGERAAYREYYRALFRKMKKLDATLTAKCDLMEKSYRTRLAQTRLEPTIPLEPPPKPELLAN